MEHEPTRWGRFRDDIYGETDFMIGHNNLSNEPKVHTQQPIVTGTSVIGVKFNKGVIIAADNLASYGSLARFTNQERLKQVGKRTVVGMSGDISDMQYIERILDQLEINESYDNDGQKLESPHVYTYLSNVLYNRRNRMNPLWNAVVVGGIDCRNENIVSGSDEKICKPFLGYTDLLGVTYSSPSLATGFGAYLAVPLLRKIVPDEESVANVTEEIAREVIDECMKVLFYRDARSLNKYSVTTITADGVKFEKDVKCQDLSWEFAKNISGYGRTQV